MARPKSGDKRRAILSAANRVIAAHGLGAATAAIAEEAGVSNGSLFTYFPTKVDLLNQLYVELKTEMGLAAMDGLPVRSGIRKQMFHVWSHWLRWTAAYPEKRRTLAQLGVSDEITLESLHTGHQAMAGIARLLEQSRCHGPLRAAPLEFVVALLNALADTTANFMIGDPAHADQHCQAAFDAMWRMLT